MGARDESRMDCTHMRVGKLTDPDPAIAYWRSKTPEERLRAAQLIRQIACGYDPNTARVQRVMRVVKLGEDDA